MRCSQIRGLLVLVCTCLSLCTVFCQITIRGNVNDDLSGEPLIGANVLIKGTTLGTVTDYDGSFEIKISDPMPVTLVFSYLGYTPMELEIIGESDELSIKLSEDILTVATVEVKGQRISEKQKAAPLTVESLDLIAIKETPADNFYDGLGALKGVDLTAASIGFKVINTRGFNSTSPVRSLQIIDGVDNQSPGLNFSLGNFLGSSELDVLKVDLVVGASSAFYGPNAFNGVISMTTKDPFFQKGLSVSVKGGERNMLEGAIRWADAFKNKQGKDFLAYKFNLFYLRADDWVADNYNPVDGSRVDADNPGRYDAVNIYGDEYYRGNDYSTSDPWSLPGLGIVYRTGYQEIDLVDYNTRNTKANAALHFRLNPALLDQSPEFIAAANFGAGTTVYQGDNRFSLKNILFFQNRFELRKRDKWFLRYYRTAEDAGDSYDPFFTALKLQEESKTNLRWAQDYLQNWLRNVVPEIKERGYPQLQVDVDPMGNITTFFDRPAAAQWILDHQSELTTWHQESEVFANSKTTSVTAPFLTPGTPEFDEKFNQIISRKRTVGGTLFTDHSKLQHLHGEYSFAPSFTDKLVVGANARLYQPNSEGTIFYDTAGVKITNFEYGIYAGVEKSLNANRWRFNLSSRLDKNENFPYLFSPAASVVWKPKPNNFFRFSFSSALRNPTLTDQYLSLNVGPATLSGNIDGVTGLATIESLLEYFNTLNPNQLQYFDIDPIRPEKVKTMEVGYRSTLFNSVFLDVGYYYNIYNDFIGYTLGADIEVDPATSFPKRLQIFRYSSNSKEIVKTQGFSAGINYYFKRFYALKGNYSWNKLISEVDDPIIPAYNTPEHKYNLGISGRDIPLRSKGWLRSFGFNVNYKWVEGFIFEGSPQFTGFIPSYGILNAQVNFSFDRINTSLKIGASNILDNLHYETYGGPLIGRLGYVTILYEFKKK